MRPLLILGALVLWKILSEGGLRKGMTLTRRDFILKLKPDAEAEKAASGIHADLGMLQAAHESANGNSALSSPDSLLEVRDNNGVIRVGAANNLFGFTAEPGTYWRKQNQPFVLMKTTEYVKVPGKAKVLSGPDANGFFKVEVERPFRAYASWGDSYRDWARLMKTSNYVEAGTLAALKAGDIKAWANSLITARYATDPKYALKLIAMGKENFA